MTIMPRINHGRWIADCPSCYSAERVAFGQDEFRCSNPECDLPPLPIMWPPHAADAWQLLACRPLPNRNWSPEEPLNVLRAENALHAHELIGR